MLQPKTPFHGALLSTRAPAKVNLTLHMLGRREDGYHVLESLVAFAGKGDHLHLDPGPRLGLEIAGPTAALAGHHDDNLVLKAARLLAERVEGLRIGQFRLAKRLPVAAGIGGGSSDAAAALRLLAALNGLSLEHPAVRDAARLAGADVSVCLDPRARMMRGVGEVVGPALGLPPLFAVLANPRVAIETPTVFRALGLAQGQVPGGMAHPSLEGLAGDDLVAALAGARNDLEEPARRVQPAVGEALSLMGGTPGCRLARMSGSGATVFGLYGGRREARSAAGDLLRQRPGWWVKATILR